MPGRRRIPNVYNLHVPMDIAAHPSAAQALLGAVIKHLSFSREQCHAPFAQLETHAQACQQQQQQPLQHRGRRKRLPSSARKAIKYYQRLTALLQLAGTIPYHQLQGMAVAVLLGSSVQRPREVYCLHFPAAMHHPGGAVPPASAAAVSAATRKLLRAVIMEHETVVEWDESPGPTKMWLLFQAPEGVLQAAPEGFSVRRAFSINLRKAFQVNLLMGGQVPPVSTVRDQQVQGQQRQQQQQQQHGGPPAPQQQQQQEVLPLASISSGSVCAHTAMEVDELLSQQLSTHMSLTDTGGADPVPVWYQCLIHVKGLKPLTNH